MADDIGKAGSSKDEDHVQPGSSQTAEGASGGAEVNKLILDLYHFTNIFIVIVNQLVKL
jgi:hypothetical protein